MSVSRIRRPLTYSEARARLYSLEHWGIKLGLDNIRQFCDRLGSPQARFLSVHVAGTNGKGSTSAYLDSILRSAGYRVGRYTSPHLRDFRERIHINGQPVSPRRVAAFVEHYWEKIVDRRYSYFEVTTALAFDAFARAGIEIAVVEVGLGGRFDATNIIDPIACVITRIARDHENVLGRTPEEIAFEKAGIIKSGIPVVIGPLVLQAEERIRGIAAERSAPVWSAYELLSDTESAGRFAGESSALRTPLSGAHQLTNLSIALAAIRVLEAQGLAIPRLAVNEGVRRTRWPARFQIDKGRPTVVYDAAHNPDGTAAIVSTWKRTFGDRRCTCIFNARPDKNYGEMFTLLSEIVADWVFCPMPDSPYISADELTQLASMSKQNAQWKDSPKEAMREACRRAKGADIVLVTGSHYLVGAIIPVRLVTGSSTTPAGERVTFSQLLAASQDRGASF